MSADWATREIGKDLTLERMKSYHARIAEAEKASEVLVNNVEFSGDCINEPGAVVEIKSSFKPLRIVSPQKVIIHDSCGSLDIYGDHISLEVNDNHSNFNFYGNHAVVTIEQNNCNLHLYGNYLTITVNDNSSNLHISGDFAVATVNGNHCNLHFHGNHSRITFMNKCRAVAHGDYLQVIKHPLADIQLGGDFIECSELPKPARKKRDSEQPETEKLPGNQTAL